MERNKDFRVGLRGSIDSQDVIVYLRKSDKKSPFVKDGTLSRSLAINWSSSISV